MGKGSFYKIANRMVNRADSDEMSQFFKSYPIMIYLSDSVFLIDLLLLNLS